MPVYNLQRNCLLYTSDAADERSSVDLGGRRIIKKKKQQIERSGGDDTTIREKEHEEPDNRQRTHTRKDH